jgi:hypothetical protein
VENRWQEAANGADLDAIRAIDPDLVQREYLLVASALRQVVDPLREGGAGSGSQPLPHSTPFTGEDGSILRARLSVVTLAVRDMQVLHRFYQGLGWPELPGGSKERSGFLLGGVLLAIYPLAAFGAEADAEPPTQAQADLRAVPTSRGRRRASPT